MKVTRDDKGTPTIHVSQDELASGEFARRMRQAVDHVGKEHAMDEREVALDPEFGTPVPDKEGYVISDEVRNVAQRVIDAHPRFGMIDTDRIVMGYALQVGKKPEGKGGIHVLAKAIKAPTLWRDLGDYEVVIWANALAWAGMTEQAREAIMAHELSHIGGRSENGTVYLLEHDVEEFAWVVRQYGQWHSGLEFFAEQLALHIDAPKRTS